SVRGRSCRLSGVPPRGARGPRAWLPGRRVPVRVAARRGPTRPRRRRTQRATGGGAHARLPVHLGRRASSMERRGAGRPRGEVGERRGVRGGELGALDAVEVVEGLALVGGALALAAGAGGDHALEEVG